MIALNHWIENEDVYPEQDANQQLNQQNQQTSDIVQDFTGEDDGEGDDSGGLFMMTRKEKESVIK